MRIYFLSFHILIFPTHHPHQKIKSLMCSCPAYGALRHRWKEHMAVRKVSRCSVSVSTLFNPRWLHLYSVTKEIFFCWSASSWDRPNSAECGDSLRTLEALLTQVVEEQWGYRLCLLERDLLPGGGQSDVHCDCIQSVRGDCQKPWLPSFFHFSVHQWHRPRNTEESDARLRAVGLLPRWQQCCVLAGVSSSGRPAHCQCICVYIYIKSVHRLVRTV